MLQREGKIRDRLTYFFLSVLLLLVAPACSKRDDCDMPLPMLSKPVIALEWRDEINDTYWETRDAASLEKFQDALLASEVSWIVTDGAPIELARLQEFTVVYKDNSKDWLTVAPPGELIYRTPDRRCIASIEGSALEEFKRIIELKLR